MLNKVFLIGRVGRDPEIRSLRDGGKVANLSVATSESWKDRNGEWQEKTQWHTVVIWNEGTVKYVENNVRKGDLVSIEGQLETRKWQDQQGNDRYSTEVIVKAFSGSLRRIPTGDKRRDDDDDGRRERRRYDRRDDRHGRYGDEDQRSYGSHELDDEIPF